MRKGDIMEEKRIDADELVVKVREMAKRVVNGESTLMSELGFGQDQMEAVYLVAYNYYNAKKYDTAARCFALLQMFNPTEYKYCLGTASSLHMLGALEPASVCYFLCCGLDQTQADPYFHLAECLIQLDQKEDALDPLETAIRLCGDNPELGAMKNKAELMMENIQVPVEQG
jgi:type III secretion system low calcium response chaperone LcrH/SycD